MAVAVKDYAIANGTLRSPTLFNILWASLMSVSTLILKPRGPLGDGVSPDAAFTPRRKPSPAMGKGINYSLLLEISVMHVHNHLV
ncbi:MAG: hypothetical protein CMP14_01520 [Rickettsiales bacterium]|nr:hypothetical protein [Rickettsiales bacterium]